MTDGESQLMARCLILWLSDPAGLLGIVLIILTGVSEKTLYYKHALLKSQKIGSFVDLYKIVYSHGFLLSEILC